MKIIRQLLPHVQPALFAGLMLVGHYAHAEDLLGYLTDSDGKYNGPSVEDNIRLIDTDKTGLLMYLKCVLFWSRSTAKGIRKSCWINGKLQPVVKAVARHLPRIYIATRRAPYVPIELYLKLKLELKPETMSRAKLAWLGLV